MSLKSQQHNCDNDDFVIEDGVLQTYIGNGGDVVIPEGVTNIDDWVFSDCRKLTSIAIPGSVQSIGERAFEACSALQSVTIPDGVQSIGDGAFAMCCNITSISLPQSVTSIGESAFYGCDKLTSVVIPAKVTQIGENAFCCDALKSVALPRAYKYKTEDIFGKNAKKIDFTYID